jgi:uncharacterized protein YjiS (DUF1127 family)
MSCYPHSEAFARRTLSPRGFFARIIERWRAARDRRRQCRELLDYLASDHRAESDLGITSHEARQLLR